MYDFTDLAFQKVDVEEPLEEENDDEDHQGHFESEFNQSQRQQLSRKGRKVGTKNIRRKRLDPALQV